MKRIIVRTEGEVAEVEMLKMRGSRKSLWYGA
jgi:hypothetical protein